MSTRPQKPHIVFLFSDTGGGHRSATEAIIEALGLEFGSDITTEMVDILKDYAPKPFDRMPDLYPRVVKIPKLWEISYKLSDGFVQTKVFNSTLWPYIRKASKELVAKHPADLIVSVHPFANTPILQVLRKQQPAPFITVVTDLVTMHALWYDKRADLCIVPTEPGKARALKGGLEESQIRVIGLPISERFTLPIKDTKAEMRTHLGWPTKGVTALLVAGGDGMGPLEKIALEIAGSNLKINLVVVAGRNQKLKERLEKIDWPNPAKIYGFVREMPEFMHASDIILTKAGPGTISEAFCAGLPIILYDRLPGQEEGNVAYVTEQGAGVWASTPQEIIQTLADWLANPQIIAAAARVSKSLAKPNAAREIARILVKIASFKV